MTPNYPAHTHRLLNLLGIEHPIIQAPMAGVSTPQLAASVSAAGALGSLGLGAGSAQVVKESMAAVATTTKQPVNLNFFVHQAPTADKGIESAWLASLAPLFQTLGAAPPASLAAPYGSFDDNPETLAALIEVAAPVVSFHFGLPASTTISALKNRGSIIIGCTTSVKDALQLERGGIDIIVAQGWEAGGHRGTFEVDRGRVQNDETLSTFSLVPKICAAVSVPVIAAGGITDGKDAAAALALGAAGVQLGTAFVGCPESAANDAYRAALKDPHGTTLMTTVFSGREARGLENRVTQTLEKHSDRVPDYPIAYAAGKALANAAQTKGDTQTTRDYSPFWAGEGFRSARDLPAAELVNTLVEELASSQEDPARASQ